MKKSILIALAVVTAVTVSINYATAADVVCAKLKDTHKIGYPVSKDALKLASYLNVKTCSKNFKAAVAAKGESIKYVIADQKLRDQLDAAKVARMKAKVSGFSF